MPFVVDGLLDRERHFLLLNALLIIFESGGNAASWSQNIVDSKHP
jgi:hypothetical protein